MVSAWREDLPWPGPCLVSSELVNVFLPWPWPLCIYMLAMDVCVCVCGVGLSHVQPPCIVCRIFCNMHQLSGTPNLVLAVVVFMHFQCSMYVFVVLAITHLYSIWWPFSVQAGASCGILAPSCGILKVVASSESSSELLQSYCHGKCKCKQQQPAQGASAKG